jgi:hypothetical protein
VLVELAALSVPIASQLTTASVYVRMRELVSAFSSVLHKTMTFLPDVRQSDDPASVEQRQMVRTKVSLERLAVRAIPQYQRWVAVEA